MPQKDQKKFLKTIVSGVIVALIVLVAGAALSGYDDTLVKKRELAEKYFAKTDLDKFFLTKQELKQYYLTKKDIEKIYATKTETIISRNEYQQLANDVHEIKTILNVILVNQGIDYIVQENCPYPPCKKKKKKNKTAVAKSHNEDDTETDE